MTALVTSPKLHLAAHVVLLLSMLVVAWQTWGQQREVKPLQGRVAVLEDENEALHERVDEVVAWLWDLTGQPMPDVTPATTELPAWTPPQSGPVERLRYMGQHRA